MQTQTIEISDTQDIVLTNQGKVVGYIRVENKPEYIRFVGQAVNIRLFSQSTFHSFACSGSITTEDISDIIDSESFVNALKVAN